MKAPFRAALFLLIVVPSLLGSLYRQAGSINNTLGSGRMFSIQLPVNEIAKLGAEGSKTEGELQQGN